MKKNRSACARRRQFSGQFYRNNRLNLALTLLNTVLAAVLNLAISWLLQQTIDLATGAAAGLNLAQLGWATAGLLAVCVVLDASEAVALPRFLSRAMGQYREYAYGELLKKNLATFTEENTAVYLSALSNDANSIETNYLQKLFSFLGNALLFAGSLALMFWYSPPLTAVALVLSALPLAASLLAGPGLAEAEEEVSRENEGFVASLKEGLNGFSVVKSFQAEKEAFALFSGHSRSLQAAKCHRLRRGSVLSSVGSTAAAAAQLGVFLAGCWMALSGWGVTAGEMVVFVNLMGYFNLFISALPDFLANRAAAGALIDKLADALAVNVQKQGRAVPGKLEEGITIQELSFSYKAGEEVLRGLSARFEAGKSYAVVGGSGSGKSTLLKCLMAGGTGYEGEIRYDGVELRQISPDSLYDLVSLVEQNVFVFDSSVRDNITMFRTFLEEKVERAERLSGLRGLVEEKGEGYRCGENGKNLSGGERQRISIARSLLRQSSVLLVDEATAALDRETAFRVAGSILDLEGLTRIVVTHALDEALLRRYDGILVLKDGTLAECGRFEELMERKGYFYSLYTVSQ
ncbi:MAG TPA: ABC transporter ATP-binding protein/permease [Candidatus Eisenbergiella merdavium]|uniref:ABC transporter ATP-binding protein/permease n=1 Tax=Candidatus Eisenbergiella merdavium TaxID=2838551 RepID=A0A9D2NDD1_9FIRM|nr:ABC transporter ATP-binding protein/permease [Candidatus Eisenbergiella merdavium]